MIEASINRKIPGYWLIISLLLYQTIISRSTFFSYWDIIGFTMLLPNFIGIGYAIFIYKRRIQSWQILLIFSVLVTTLIKVVYFGEFLFFKFNLFFIIAVLLAGISSEKELYKFVEIASKVLFIVLIGAVIGFILYLIGIKPFFSFIGANSRFQSFYWTTFGHPSGDILRPNGIFDEPGTLAFTVGIVLVLRQQFKMDVRLSLAILYLTFITFSLAFMVFSIFYLLSIEIPKKHRFSLIGLLLVFIISIIVTPLNDFFNDYLLNRFTLDRDQAQSFTTGRYGLMELAYDNLIYFKDSYLWGVTPFCAINNAECMKYGYMAENPLDPLAHHGIFMSWPYYVFIILLVLFGVRNRKSFVFLAIAVLFLQRPYLLNYGTSLLGILPLIIHFKYKPKLKEITHE